MYWLPIPNHPILCCCAGDGTAAKGGSADAGGQGQGEAQAEGEADGDGELEVAADEEGEGEGAAAAPVDEEAEHQRQLRGGRGGVGCSRRVAVEIACVSVVRSHALGTGSKLHVTRAGIGLRAQPGLCVRLHPAAGAQLTTAQYHLRVVGTTC